MIQCGCWRDSHLWVTSSAVEGQEKKECPQNHLATSSSYLNADFFRGTWWLQRMGTWNRWQLEFGSYKTHCSLRGLEISYMTGSWKKLQSAPVNRFRSCKKKGRIIDSVYARNASSKIMMKWPWITRCPFREIQLLY